MSYLAIRKNQLILACFLLSSSIFINFPQIDIGVAALFYDRGFPLKEFWWNRLLHPALSVFLCLGLIVPFGLYLFNKLRRRNVGIVDGKTVFYLFLVMLVGAGLVVNVVLKDHFGRARPRDIQEFGGALRFTPAFVVSDQCDRNCSFSCGDGAAAFFAMALARAFSRRRSVMFAAVSFGSLVSLLRMQVGAHFFSDAVVSFFIMLIVTDVLYHYMLRSGSRGVPTLLVIESGAPS